MIVFFSCLVVHCNIVLMCRKTLTCVKHSVWECILYTMFHTFFCAYYNIRMGGVSITVSYMVQGHADRGCRHRSCLPTQGTRGIHPMLFQCWSCVFDAGATLKQHWVNAPCLLSGRCACQCLYSCRTVATIDYRRAKPKGSICLFKKWEATTFLALWSRARQPLSVASTDSGSPDPELCHGWEPLCTGFESCVTILKWIGKKQ